MVVRGSWDNWKDELDLVKVSNFDPKISTWVGSKPLQVGQEFEYKYIVDGVWQDPKDKQYNKNSNHTVFVHG